MMLETASRFQRHAPVAARARIQPYMKKIQLEQQPPNKPSFLKVVLISAGAVIVIFILAIIALHVGHGRIEHPLRGHPSHPTSQLVRPSEGPDGAVEV